MAKNTGRGFRRGAVKGRSEMKVGLRWLKRDTTSGRFLNVSNQQHKGVRNESSPATGGGTPSPGLTPFSGG